jgi:uncharacterized protein YgbK (DUF1537 family)
VPDSQPAAADVFAGLPAPRTDSAALRESVRALRAAGGPLIGVLDDDPTGSQSVHGVQVVTVLAESAYAAALDTAAGTCFVLTNTRSLDEPAAVELNRAAARGLLAVAGRRRARLQLVSRSDSTLRGHVFAEVTALAAAQREVSGHGCDAVLLIPAFLEAGRVTAADIHWARVGTELVPVGQTEFARDPAFGYGASDLRDFVAEKSGGAIARDQVASISLADIRLGGPGRVAERLAAATGGAWVVVNATEYADLEAVACGMLLAGQAGQSFLLRTGPSFVRALSGLDPQPPLRGARLGRPRADGGHGLIVVGSHVGQTGRQLAALRAAGGVTSIELDVPAILGGADVVPATARRASAALGHSDVLLYTSRAVAAGQDRSGSLAIARTVSTALADAVRAMLPAQPGWVIAKGGITSHDVATRGLGIRRAEVAGQLFPGMISVLRPVDAAPEAIGLPYVVFAGNVGDDGTLAQVVRILNDPREG